MPIDVVNSSVNTANGYSVGFDAPKKGSLPTTGSASPPSLSPEEIQKICSPPTVPLDPESTQQLATYVAYNASLTALAQTLSLSDDLAKHLGNQ